jgi:hypothetical protein
MVKRRKNKIKRKTKPKKKVNREKGYYWIKVSNGQNSQWVIGKWWPSLNFFDTIQTLRETGTRDVIIKVDERKIINPNI